MEGTPPLYPPTPTQVRYPQLVRPTQVNMGGLKVKDTNSL